MEAAPAGGNRPLTLWTDPDYARDCERNVAVRTVIIWIVDRIVNPAEVMEIQLYHGQNGAQPKLIFADIEMPVVRGQSTARVTFLCPFG